MKTVGAKEVFTGNYIEILLCPKGFERPVYHFAVNLAGQKEEVLHAVDANRPDVAWKSDWQAAVGRDDEGFVCELGIPFASLGVDTPKRAETWAINVTRNRPEDEGRAPGPARLTQWANCNLNFQEINGYGQLRF